MAVPSKSVIECDGFIQCEHIDYFLDSVFGSMCNFREFYRDGYFYCDTFKCAVTAECAAENGWIAMAECWRDSNGCLSDCIVFNCSSEDCLRIKRRV